MNEAEKVDHQVVRSADKKKATGKEMGLPFPPEVSLNPMSSEQAEDKSSNPSFKDQKNLIIKKASLHNLVTDDNKGKGSPFPFLDLEIDQGVFIPATDKLSTDELMEKTYRDIANVRKYYGYVERDENGDEILEMLCIKERKRNDDGTIQLQNGQPLVGANFTQSPKLTSSHSFIVRAIVKDDDLGDNQKAPSDGVMIIRV